MRLRSLHWSRPAGLLAAAVALAACGGGSGDSSGSAAAKGPETAGPALIAAAKKEGSVSWYTSMDTARVQRVAQAFEDKYGIKVKSLRLAGNQLTTRYTTDAKAGNTPDVVDASVPTFFQAGAKAGTFLPLSKADEPAFASWPKSATLNADTTAIVSIAPYEVIVNTDVVKTMPTSMQDLLKPEFKKNMLMPDPRIIPPTLGMTEIWLEKLGPDYLRKFGQQQPTIVESAVPGMQSLAAGEAAALVTTEPGVAQPLIDQGAPLKGISLAPTVGTELGMAVSKAASQPNAAKLFMNYVLSPAGQEDVNGLGRVSPLPNIKGTKPLPPGYYSADLDKASANEKKIVGLLGLG